VIRRDVPAEPQSVLIDLEGVPSGTGRLLVTAAPFSASGGDLREADRAHTWSVGLRHFPDLEIKPVLELEHPDSSNDVGGLEPSVSVGMLSEPWTLSLTPAEVERLGPGLSVQVVMVDFHGENLLCTASLAES
jgi:hypothetical protein